MFGYSFADCDNEYWLETLLLTMVCLLIFDIQDITTTSIQFTAIPYIEITVSYNAKMEMVNKALPNKELYNKHDSWKSH